MFAGPNGSGKSTIKSVINKELLGVYINPDDILVGIKASGYLDLLEYNVQATEEEIIDFFSHSTLLEREGLCHLACQLTLDGSKLNFVREAMNDYFTSVVSDFLRQKLLVQKISFTFETVMSSVDKVHLLQKARDLGYRTYLYYVATSDPEINISRVQSRVKSGGHDVPRDKIINRYYRSLGLLNQAIVFSNRAYIFDNSTQGRLWLAEVTDGEHLEFKTDKIPAWFQRYVLGTGAGNPL